MQSFLPLSVVSFAFTTTAWADKGGEKKAYGRIAALEKQEQKVAAEAPFGSAKISANGLAVEKSNGTIETADAPVVLTGTAYKNSGDNHARIFLSGTRLILAATTTTCVQTARSGSTTR